MVPPIVHAQHRVARTLRDAAAADPASARQLFDLNRMEERALQRLVSAGVIRREGADRYFLDHAAWADFRRSRRMRALVAMAAALVVLGAILLLAAQRPG
jgi:hypothetical protein